MECQEKPKKGIPVWRGDFRRYPAKVRVAAGVEGMILVHRVDAIASFRYT